jgi:protoheme IX farnesyltransferase
VKAAVIEPPVVALERGLTMADCAQLIKARLTTLVLITTAVGFYVGWDGPMNFGLLAHAIYGTALAAAGASALNQWSEYRFDAIMLRTRSRPIPAGHLLPSAALIAGTLLAIAGVAYLAVAVNFLSALLAAITVALYIFAYTPLKKISTTNTLVGAIPGAIPPMIGWTAARGTLDAGGWSLFVILFFWQLPHFFALAWMYRADYARAGFRMMSNDDESGARSSSQSVLFCIMLLVVAGLPGYIGLATTIYVPIALALSGWFVAMAMRFHGKRTPQAARALFLTSIIYLPLLLATLVLTKR